MTYTDNTETRQQAVKSFHRLSVDEQVVALATLYAEIADSLKTANQGAAPSKNVAELMRHAKEMKPENQLQFLQDILSEKATQRDETALDPHPSKALIELLPGGSKPPISQYNDLSGNDRLGFWYLFAQNLGKDGAIALPATLQTSAQTTELMNSLKSLDFEEKVAFLNQIL
jgi:Orange carotenoid protein, N-terminal